MNLIINGMNFSSLVNRRRYFTSSVTIDGGRGGILRNGVRIVDKRDTKRILRCVMNPMTQEQYLALDIRCRENSVAVRSDDFPDFNPVEMMAGMSEAEVMSIGGKKLWSGITLTLEEC